MESTITIAIFENHPITAKGLETLLQQQRGMAFVASYFTKQDLIKGLEMDVPSILVFEIENREIQGEELLAYLRENNPGTRMIVYTISESISTVKTMLRLGSSGYLIKTSSEAEIISCIKAVARGELYVQQSLKEQILQKALLNNKIGAVVPTLTKREKEILQLLSSNFSSQEIAEKLFISKKTVENHRSNMLEKFKVKNAASLIKKAIEYDLLS